MYVALAKPLLCYIIVNIFMVGVRNACLCHFYEFLSKCHVNAAFMFG